MPNQAAEAALASALEDAFRYGMTLHRALVVTETVWARSGGREDDPA